ncbi:hypothetical protein MMC25_002153 [Agyrium rufum]|nr:hypothetical protein [Agyrium rufum]
MGKTRRPTTPPKEISPPPTKRRRLSTLPVLPANLAAPTLALLKPNQLRIFAWNINGITSFLQPSITSFFQPTSGMTKKHARSRSSSPSNPPSSTKSHSTASLLDCLKRWQYPQILCLQEVHIGPLDRSTIRSLRLAVGTKSVNHEYTYVIQLSLPSPDDKYNAQGRQGKRRVHGVCTMIRKDIETEVKTWRPSWDLEGRVLMTEFRALNIAIINIYASNGTFLPYYLPEDGSVIGTRHKLKRTFQTKLADLIAEMKRKGKSVVAAGDFNIARFTVDGSPNHRQGTEHIHSWEHFEKKFTSSEGLGMIDSFREMHGKLRKFTYRPPSAAWGESGDRVDLMLLTPNIIPQIPG